MNTKKVLRVKMVLLSCMLTMVFLFTACGGSSEKTQSSDSTKEQSTTAQESKSEASESSATTEAENKEPVKLNIWIAGTGEAVFDQAYRKVLDAYSADHPNVSYELTFIPWSEYFTKLNTGLIGGAGPDIFMLGYGQMGSVQNAGNVLALNDYIPKDWDGYTDFNENILNICKKDGVMYGLFKPSTRTFMYRKDIAAQNGVTEEDLQIASQEDLFNLVRKMTVYDEKKKVKIFGLDVDPDTEQTYFTFSSQLTDKFSLWNDDLTADFGSEIGVKAMTNLYSLYKEGVVGLMDPSAAVGGLTMGTSAMSIGADSTYASASAAFPGQIGVVKNDMNTLLIGDYLAVNAQTEYPEVATDLLLHMFSIESCGAFAEITSQYSGRQSLDDAFIALNPDYENIVNSYGKSHSYSTVMNPKYGAVISILRLSLDAIFQGDDIKTTLDNASEGWNAEFKK